MTQILKWLRYFAHVPPRKILGKVAHAVKSRAISWFPSVLLAPWPVADEYFDDAALAAFASTYRCMGDRFHDAHLLEQGIFSVKGVAKDFGSIEAIRWDNPFPDEPDKLHWMHDLAFFSFSIRLVEENPVRGIGIIARLVNTLQRAHPIADGKLHFVWSPIALALRILGLSAAASLARAQGCTDVASFRLIAEHIAYCSALLDSTAERYLGYNHHVFAAAALAVGACATGNQDKIRKFGNEAASAIMRHVLDDGFWSERSPTYHIHMLLLAQCINAMDATSEDIGESLRATIAKMEAALPVVVHADGEIAIFNDAAIEDSVPPASVGWREPSDNRFSAILPQAGYAQLRAADTTVIFDAGVMGPDDVIGHGHGDFLSVEVCWRGTRLLVDPGVASIVGGELRHRTRSAEYHNGPTFVGLEPAEFFGAWRVGRRGRAGFEPPKIVHSNGGVSVSGWCDGYKHLTGDQLVMREVRLNSSGAVEIKDTWPTPSAYRRRVTLLIPVAWSLENISENSAQLMRNGEVVNLLVENAVLGTICPQLWYPRGPMKPEHATCIVVHPNDGYTESSIRLG
ncbi:heparinase II/III-family protein [Pseudoxanthomonas sp. SGT-18]|uniref:heparinase II/III family protein n=1 Tax=Pseudoxanthomonas sp. SGT-18 TaxID=2493087 RepID=UPI000F629C5A|nr:heparinase II/III-family protein [Pseudoxanthomonas sp. SGT-18]